MKSIIAYIRVSSREQGKSGIGLEVQEAKIRGYAEANVRLVRVYQEVKSAIGGDTLSQRPQLQAALEHARRLECPVVVTALDRLARDAKEIEKLASTSGVEIISIQTSPDTLLQLRSHAAGVQKQTELLKDRLSEGVRLAKERGVVFGNQKNLSEAQKKGARSNRDAAKVRQRELAPIIAGIRAKGVHTGAEIAQQLNRLGNRTARGQEWTDQNLRRVLRQIDHDQKDRARSDAADRENPNWGIM